MPIWNEQYGGSNLIRIIRLGVYLIPFTFNFYLSPADTHFIIVILFATLSGISMYYLVKFILLEDNEKYNCNCNNIRYACLSSSFVYFFSTYVIESSVHPGIVYSYYLAPLNLLILIKGLKENKYKFTIFSALLWSISCIDAHWIFYGFFLFIGLIIYNLICQLNLQFKKDKINILKTHSIHIFLLLTFFMLFSSYWSIPSFISGGSSRYGNILTIEGLKIWFRNASPTNLFAMKSNFNLEQMYGNVPLVIQKIHLNLFLYLIVIFGLSSLFFRNTNRYKYFFSFLFLSCYTLSIGPNLFVKFYNWFIFEAPFHSFYNWAFRTSKISQFMILAISPLVGFTYMNIFKRIKKYGVKINLLFSITFCFIIFISTIVPNYPFLTGDMNGNLKKIRIPTEFNVINDWLATEEGDFKVFWAPQYSQIPSWNVNPTGKIAELLSGKPTYLGWNSYYFATLGIEYPFKSIMLKNASKNLGGFYSPLNVKYLIIHNDIPKIKSKVDALLENLDNQNDLKLVRKDGFITVFELNNQSEHIEIKNNILSLYGGLSKYNSLSYTGAFDPIETAVIYDDLRITNLHSDIFVLGDPTDVQIDNILGEATIFKIFDYTNHYNPDKFWSKTILSSVDFRNELNKQGLENFQFDYGEGLVFTWAASKLIETPTPTSNDLIDQWTFESINDLGQWKNYIRETQFGTLHPLTLDNGALKAELWNSTWGWKTINSPPITVDYGNWYRLELRLRGENIHGAHIKAVEYNESGQSINAKTLQTIGTGNIDWKNITLDYTPEKPETKYIQLQIWHGHETTQPLPNTIWIDHLKVYDLERFIEPVTLEIPYTVPKTDQYILLARVFQNQQGGRILVQNDQETYPIYTRDQLNKFTWTQLDNTTLQQGQHKLTLTNLEGFNAVNLFALVPAQEYREAQTRLTETLQTKRIIHVLEAETDLYHNNATTTNKYGAEASNGETLELTPGSTTWRIIETAKPSDYTVAVRGKGNLNIKIDEQTYQTHTNQLDWTYLDPIHLDTGTHRIEITQHPTQSHQWDFEDNETNQWTATSPTNQTLTLTKNPYGDGTSLKTEITAPITIWKTVTTPLIPAAPETTYTWSLQVAGENAHKAYIKILEYDENRKPLTATQVASIGDGNYAWTPVSIQYTPTPDAAHIALQLWHGHESTQPLPNRIWVDDVQVTDSQPTDLDVVWIYSTDKPGETLQDIFTADQAPAQLIEYNKIDPTKYEATINASKPFMLSFAESYDPLWVARVNGQKITSIPLYSVINGFWIQETGLIDVTIEYEPQRWFYIGSAISITALTASLAYLATPYLREKGITLKTITNHARKHLTRKEPPEKPE